MRLAEENSSGYESKLKEVLKRGGSPSLTPSYLVAPPRGLNPKGLTFETRETATISDRRNNSACVRFFLGGGTSERWIC
jgi:hypothetical protein